MQRDGVFWKCGLFSVSLPVNGEGDIEGEVGEGQEEKVGQGKHLNKMKSCFYRFMSNPRVTLTALKLFSFEKPLFFRRLIFRKWSWFNIIQDENYLINLATAWS